MKFLSIVLKNVRGSPVRTLLTVVGTGLSVIVITLIWSVLYFLDQVTSEKSQNLKVIVTERWQIPSQMPVAYAEDLASGAARHAGDIRPADAMTWSFYGGTLDPAKQTRENILFAFALDPRKLATMMDELDSLPEDQAAELQRNIGKLVANRRGLIVGQERLKAINKRVGERITVTSMNYKEIDLEFEIVGVFPPGRYDQSAAMNAVYLNDALEEYPRSHQGKTHPMADKSLNLVWLRVPEMESFSRVADQIMTSPVFSSPAVKVETASSGISSFLEAYKDILWGMRWLMSPAILFTLALLNANAISISVRQRRMEMAVLKVLGFSPGQIMSLILAESMIVGTLAGLLTALGTYWLINDVAGGLKMPIAFFPAFFVPGQAIVWGVAIGSLTALAGSLMPALSARNVNVAEVFSKVA